MCISIIYIFIYMYYTQNILPCSEPWSPINAHSPSRPRHLLWPSAMAMRQVLEKASAPEVINVVSA